LRLVLPENAEMAPENTCFEQITSGRSWRGDNPEFEAIKNPPSANRAGLKF
jgi:hypothetical protein